MSNEIKSIDKTSSKFNAGGKTPRDKDKLQQDVKQIYENAKIDVKENKNKILYASNKLENKFTIVDLKNPKNRQQIKFEYHFD